MSGPRVSFSARLGAALYQSRATTASKTGSADTIAMRRRTADAASRRSNGSRCGHSIIPANRLSAASSAVATPPCRSRRSERRSTCGAISGHLPSRTFWAISKNEIALTRIFCAFVSSPRARSVIRRSFVRDQAQTCVSSKRIVSGDPPRLRVRRRPWARESLVHLPGRRL
jgi:hypothetical protein